MNKTKQLGGKPLHSIQHLVPTDGVKSIAEIQLQKSSARVKVVEEEPSRMDSSFRAPFHTIPQLPRGQQSTHFLHHLPPHHLSHEPTEGHGCFNTLKLRTFIDVTEISKSAIEGQRLTPSWPNYHIPNAINCVVPFLFSGSQSSRVGEYGSSCSAPLGPSTRPLPAAICFSLALCYPRRQVLPASILSGKESTVFCVSFDTTG